MPREMYVSGEYLQNNPMWHAEESPWKAKQILKIMERNNIAPKTICEVGCGAGEILARLQHEMPVECEFLGYEISPQAFELSRTRANEKLNFKLADILEEKGVFYDLILIIDLIEHLEDYYTFLREIKSKSQYKILHIPLEISAQFILRNTPFLESRKSAGHLHYYTKDIALHILRDVGYEVLDYFYTSGSTEIPSKSIKRNIVKLPRKVLFAIDRDLAVRILGGYSLMVLARWGSETIQVHVTTGRLPR